MKVPKRQDVVQLVKECLHIAFLDRFSAHLKMGSMLSYGAVYT